MKSPTLNDVARLAGVSYATADRVVNRRGNVAAKSVHKVMTAVEQLGYVRNVAAANLSRGRTYRLGFLIPRSTNAFFDRMRRHLDRIALDLRREQVELHCRDIDPFDAGALERDLTRIANEGFDGLAIVGLTDTRLSAALDRLRAAGTRVVALVSDLPEGQHDGYVGIDNHKAGRAAARLLGLSFGGRYGTALALMGAADASDHRDRIAGFRDVLDQDFPNIELHDIVETRDAPDRVRRALSDALSSDARIGGVYNAGAGNAGLTAALARHGRPAPFCAIAHELDPQTREALQAGIIDIIIDQRPEVEVTRAVTRLRALADDRPAPAMPELTPAIYLQDTLPDDLI